MQERPTVTAAEIARLAAVGRAAVSNWRKRHADFPVPVGGTTSSPEFDLVQVEEWLRQQGKLPEQSAEDRAWAQLVASGDNLAATLAAVGECLLKKQRGEALSRGVVRSPTIQAAVDLADEDDAPAVFDHLWRRFVQAQAWRVGVTPDALTDLVASLAGVRGGRVLDPACGTGNMLRAAVRAGCTAAFGQELDKHTAALGALWSQLHGISGRIEVGDSLRADAFANLTVDAVVSNPPFGDSNWGHEELAYDPRWQYGTPSRTEPELAWVQHALAHLRPGGAAVLLMPPSAASRRAGRRIRSELLRRGALRAVIALPAKAAAPHGVPLQLWVLRRPEPSASAPTQVLLVDAVDGAIDTAYARILATFQEFSQSADAFRDQPGFARAVPLIELLDEEVDLTPARRLPVEAGDSAGEFARSREQLVALLARLPELVPDLPIESHAVAASTVSLVDLAKSGALQILGPVRPDGGQLDAPATDMFLRRGDVVVPNVAPQLTARVVDEDGGPLGPNLYLLRPNPEALDSWFLAGQIHTATNERQAATVSGTFRFDVRRTHVPRVSLDEQRRIGAAFRLIDAFDGALGRAAALGAQVVRAAAEGLASGLLQPNDGTVRKESLS